MLNQPLTSILANVEAGERLPQSDAADIGEIREILKDIASDDKRAASIIGQLRRLMLFAPKGALHQRVKNCTPVHTELKTKVFKPFVSTENKARFRASDLPRDSARARRLAGV